MKVIIKEELDKCYDNICKTCLKEKIPVPSLLQNMMLGYDYSKYNISDEYLKSEKLLSKRQYEYSIMSGSNEDYDTLVGYWESELETFLKSHKEYDDLVKEMK